MVVVAAAVVGIVPVSGLELGAQSLGPFLPGEPARSGELDGQGKRLGLPGLGKYRPLIVSGLIRRGEATERSSGNWNSDRRA